MLIKNRIIIFLATVVLALAACLLCTDRTESILQNSQLFEMPSVNDMTGYPRRWVNGGIFILKRQSDHNVTAVLYNPLTASETVVSNIGGALSAIASSNWRIYAHSNWLVLDAISDTNPISFLCDLKMHLMYTNSAKNFLHGDLFWMPNKLAWLRVSGQKIKLEQAAGSKETLIDRQFRPVFPVGFVEDGVFAAATNYLAISSQSDLPYPRTISLGFWRLDSVPRLLKVERVSINGDYIIRAAASEQGDKILWICYHKLRIPGISISGKRFTCRYDIRFYLSSSDADRFYCIGSIPTTEDFPHVQWLPDGRGIFFEYESSWYIYQITGRDKFKVSTGSPSR